MVGKTARRARLRGGWIVLGVLALGLAACGTPQPGEPTAMTPPAPPAVDDGLARNDTTPAAPDADTLATVQTTAPADAGRRLPDPATPEVALAVPTAALPGPERLMGLSGDEVKALLGSPGFIRRDPPAEIWQYGTDSCVLDVFLYSQEKGGAHRVSHFEFRGRTVAGVTPADCYRQLLAARARGPAG